MAPLVTDRSSLRQLSVDQFALIFEGEKTEVRYMQRIKELMNHNNDKVVLYEKSEDQATTGKSNIPALIKRAKLAEREILSEYNTRSKERIQFWILVDYDRNSHSMEQFIKLENWSSNGEQHQVAISSPKFEMWLLLHFECAERYSKEKLNKHLPGFTKSMDSVAARFNPRNIQTAIDNAYTLAKIASNSSLPNERNEPKRTKRFTPSKPPVINCGFPSCQIPKTRGSAVALLIEKIMQLRKSYC